jgi:hypothetical protein
MKLVGLLFGTEPGAVATGSTTQHADDRYCSLKDICRPLKRAQNPGGVIPGLRSLLAHPGLLSAAAPRLVERESKVGLMITLFYLLF